MWQQHAPPETGAWLVRVTLWLLARLHVTGLPPLEVQEASRTPGKPSGAVPTSPGALFPKLTLHAGACTKGKSSSMNLCQCFIPCNNCLWRHSHDVHPPSILLVLPLSYFIIVIRFLEAGDDERLHSSGDFSVAQKCTVIMLQCCCSDDTPESM